MEISIYIYIFYQRIFTFAALGYTGPYRCCGHGNDPRIVVWVLDGGNSILISASLCMYEERLVIFTSNIGNVRRRETLLPWGCSRYTNAAICTVYSKQYELNIGKNSMTTRKKNIFTEKYFSFIT